MSFSDHINKSIRENARIRGRSTGRLKKIKELYIGTGNKPNISKTTLTPAQLAEGRKRAKAYCKKRNIRIYTQIILLTVFVLFIVGYFFNKYLLH